MKNIKHNAAQVAAPSNLSSPQRDRFLGACARQETSKRTARRLVSLVGRLIVQMTGREGRQGGGGSTGLNLSSPAASPQASSFLSMACKRRCEAPCFVATQLPRHQETPSASCLSVGAAPPSADRGGLISALRRIFARWQPPVLF